MRACAGCLLLAHGSLLSLAMPSIEEAASICLTIARRLRGTLSTAATVTRREVTPSEGQLCEMRRQEIETLPEKDGKRTYILRDLNRKGSVILSPEALAQLAEDLNRLLQAKEIETGVTV
jgi:hypothetical protein